MTAAAKKILEEALALSEEERSELISALSDSLEQPPVDLGEAWTAEVGQRIAQLESGEVRAVAWDAVDARIRRALDRK